MVERSAGRNDRLSLARLRVLVAGIGALVFAASYSPSASEAQTHKALAPAAATGAFGLDLMRAGAPGNLVLSPDSVAAALAMAGTGAAGRTAAQMASTLHLTNPAAFPALWNLQRTIASEQASAGQGHPKAPTLELANGLFLQQGFPIEPTFLSGLQQHFGAAPETVDFSADPTGAVEAIDAWVSAHTAGIIPQLLTSLPEETRLALANAVYLKASWLHPFEQGETSPAPFYTQARKTRAEFMHQTARLRYGSGPGYAALDLPYRASTLSLLVVLPNRRKGVNALQRHLGARGLARIVHSLRPRSVRLSLPRFHLDTQTELNEPLKKLGMPIAFSEAANFSHITTAEHLKIGLVEHAADFRVDEEGTEAAAATAVVFVGKSRLRSPHSVTFNANHPFLFFLRDDRTGAVLFAGRLTDPTSTGA